MERTHNFAADSASCKLGKKPWEKSCFLTLENDVSVFGGPRQLVSELGSLSSSDNVDLNCTMSRTMLEPDIGKQQVVISKVNSHGQPTGTKGLNKPNKCLACPRCNSVDTKFCYYNNYNVNQPRHFCKGCQRYWTAGGTLRNVAVGAGKRKRKHASLESEHHTHDVEDEPSMAPNNKTDGITGLEKAPLLPFEVVASRSPLPGTYCEEHVPKLVGSLQKSCKNEETALCFFSREPTATDVDSNCNNGSDSSRPRVSTASEMQPSNESGCASSLTTQTGSFEASGQDSKFNAMDSEVTNGSELGQDVDKTAFHVLCNGALRFAHVAPWMIQIAGDASALNDATTVPLPGSSKGTGDLFASAVKGPMISAGLTWGPLTDKALSWGPPWGPAATAVDAAKAAMIPKVASSHELPRTVSETRLWAPKTIRIKHPDDAACSSIWLKLGIGDCQGSVLSDNLKDFPRTDTK